MTYMRSIRRWLERHQDLSLTAYTAIEALSNEWGIEVTHNTINNTLMRGARLGYFTRTRSGREYRYSLNTGNGAYIATSNTSVGTGTSTGPVSFGVECEMDFLTRTAYRDDTPRYREQGYIEGNIMAHTRGWSAHHDGTVGIEIVSPAFTSIGEAQVSMQRQWLHWIEGNVNTDENMEAVPYFTGSNPGGNRSIGHHIHIGRFNGILNFEEKKKIADNCIGVYPMILSFAANTDPYPGVLSRREAIDSTYCRDMASIRDSLARGSTGTGSEAHYYEISDSTNHGTLEFRGQDANVPQVILTITFLLKTIAERALKNEIIATTNFNYDYWQTYRTLRAKGVSTGFSFAEKQEYLEKLIALTGDVSLAEASQAIKEVLYITFKANVLPVELYRQYVSPVIVNKFNYFKKMLTNPETYLGNFVGIANKDFTEWITEASRLTKLSDLRTTVTPTVTPVVPQAGGFMRLGEFAQASNQPVYEVARQIALLLNPGEPSLGTSTNNIIDTPDRFYVRGTNRQVTDFIVETSRRSA